MGVTPLRVVFTGITVLLTTILLLWYYEMQLHFGFKIAIGATLLLYLFIPLLFHFSASVQRNLVFLPFVRWPADVDFDHPETQGLLGGRNFYLNPSPTEKIGVWHLLPSSLADGSKGKASSYWDESLRSSGKPILIYLHGNSGSRAGEHRKELYVILQKLDFHVIAFDYRGYADSTEIPPSETSCIVDGTLVYNWVQNILGNSSQIPVFMWGHSLGSGVSTHLVSNLCLGGRPPKGLFLEAPFTSLGEEVREHILSSLWRYMPFFDYIFVQPLTTNDIEFDSTKHLPNIHIPIFIFHAIDDPVIPFDLGKKLYRLGKESRPKSAAPIYFKGFGEGYAHKFICRAPELPKYITDFTQCSIGDHWPCSSLEEPSEVA